LQNYFEVGEGGKGGGEKEKRGKKVECSESILGDQKKKGREINSGEAPRVGGLPSFYLRTGEKRERKGGGKKWWGEERSFRGGREKMKVKGRGFTCHRRAGERRFHFCDDGGARKKKVNKGEEAAPDSRREGKGKGFVSHDGAYKNGKILFPPEPTKGKERSAGNRKRRDKRDDGAHKERKNVPPPQASHEFSHKVEAGGGGPKTAENFGQSEEKESFVSLANLREEEGKDSRAPRRRKKKHCADGHPSHWQLINHETREKNH